MESTRWVILPSATLVESLRSWRSLSPCSLLAICRFSPLKALEEGLGSLHSRFSVPVSACLLSVFVFTSADVAQAPLVAVRSGVPIPEASPHTSRSRRFPLTFILSRGGERKSLRPHAWQNPSLRSQCLCGSVPIPRITSRLQTSFLPFVYHAFASIRRVTPSASRAPRSKPSTLK